MVCLSVPPEALDHATRVPMSLTIGAEEPRSSLRDESDNEVTSSAE